MRSASDGAELALVKTEPGEDPHRKELLERANRLHLGEMTEDEVRKILTIAPETWVKIQEGLLHVRKSSYTKAQTGLDAYVEEHGLQHLDRPELEAAGTFEFSASIGAADLRFTAKGRPEDADLIREQVIKAVLNFQRATAQGDVE